MCRLLVVLALVVAAGTAPALAPEEAQPAPPRATAPAPGDAAVVVLTDGQSLRGTLGERDAGGVTLSLAGGNLVVPAGLVREVLAPHEAAARTPAPSDPNRTRYLYSPSAFLLRQGEGYVSQTELAITSVAIGATDWLTLQAGTVIPVLFYDPKSLPFVLAAKAGGSPTPWLHLAAGFQALVLPGVAEAPSVGFAFGTVTVGDERRHLSLSLGPPFALSHGSTQLGSLLASVSGALRLSPSFALVSENWIVPIDGSTHLIGSGALRFIAARLGIDVGLVFVQGAQVPVPWLDFTWHWE
jgi:hypothetical protein